MKSGTGTYFQGGAAYPARFLAKIGTCPRFPLRARARFVGRFGRSLLLSAALATSGCAAHVDVVPWEQRTPTPPPPDRSLVYIVRPFVGVGAHEAAVFDGETYIGTLDQEQHVAYLTIPGLHRFAVMSEVTDFMEAELAPGKTYYAGLRHRPGVAVDRFSFDPNTESIAIEKTRALVERTEEVRPNEDGRRWAKKNEKTFRVSRWRAWRNWQAKRIKQTLPIYAGR